MVASLCSDGDVLPVETQTTLNFWDRPAKNCAANSQIQDIQSVEETPYDGKLYKLPGDAGIHSLLRPDSYTDRWHNHASHLLMLPVLMSPLLSFHPSSHAMAFVSPGPYCRVIFQ